MTSELKHDLSSFGYADGGYMSKCSQCKETFLGEKRSWSCEPCAIKKSIEPKITRAVPDVSEIDVNLSITKDVECNKPQSVALKHDVPELVRYRIWFDSNYNEIVDEDQDGEYVRHSQASKIIAAKDKEIYQLICALSACQKALNSLVSEESIKNTTVVNAYAMCVDAELKARKALKGEINV